MFAFLILVFYESSNLQRSTCAASLRAAEKMAENDGKNDENTSKPRKKRVCLSDVDRQKILDFELKPGGMSYRELAASLGISHQLVLSTRKNASKREEQMKLKAAKKASIVDAARAIAQTVRSKGQKRKVSAPSVKVELTEKSLASLATIRRVMGELDEPLRRQAPIPPSNSSMSSSQYPAYIASQSRW